MYLKVTLFASFTDKRLSKDSWYILCAIETNKKAKVFASLGKHKHTRTNFSKNLKEQISKGIINMHHLLPFLH